MSKDYSLEDLVKITGLSLRTLRYYIQEGLLQGPDTHGKNARYSQTHLDQLELIQRLKNLHVPLQEIRHLLNNITPQELTRVRQYQEKLRSPVIQEKSIYAEETPVYKADTSALDYIRSLENKWDDIRTLSEPDIAAPGLASPLPSPYPILEDESHERSEEELWTRVTIEDGLELNIRQPREYEEQEKLALLIEYARKLFGDPSNKGDEK